MEQAVVGALVLGVVLVAAATTGLLWVRRAARRRVRSWRQQVAASKLGQAREWAQRVDARALVRPEPFDATWRAAYRSRWRMQRAVRAARDAVCRAESAGAPIGDLAGVLQRTAHAAGQVDALVTLAGRDATFVDTAAQAASVARAADAIREAAVRAVMDSSGAVVARAVADADDEAAAVLAGLDRVRSI